MATLTMDLSASRGLYRQVGGAQYQAANNDNLIYDAEDGQVVSGVYNPFRYPGYIAPAVNAWVDQTWAMALDYDTVNNELIRNPLVIGMKYYDRNGGVDYIGHADELTLRNPGETFGIVDGDKIFSTIFAPYAGNDPVNDTGIIYDLAIGQLNGERGYYFIDGSNLDWNDDFGGSGFLEETDWQGDIADNPNNFNNLNQGSEAFLVDGKNGIMYVGDEFSIHGADGSIATGVNGRFDANLLTFPEYYFLKGGSEFRGKLYFTYKLHDDVSYREEINHRTLDARCGVFVWNKKSITGSEYDSITVDGVMDIRHIWNDGQALYLISISISGKTQIRMFDGKTFNVIFEFGKTIIQNDVHYIETTIGNTPYVVTENGTYIMTNSGDIYCVVLGSNVVHKVGELDFPNLPEGIQTIIPLPLESNNMNARQLYTAAYNPDDGTWFSAGAIGTTGGYSQEYFTSPNGSIWTRQTAASLPSTNSFFTSSMFNESGTLCIHDAVNGTIYYSTNLTTFTNATYSGPVTATLGYLGGTIDTFLSLSQTASTNSIYYSTTGATWSASTLSKSVSFYAANSFTYNPNTNKGYVVGTETGSGELVIYETSNGSTWTEIDSFLPVGSSASIAYSETLNLYVISTSSKLYYSEDLTTWTDIDKPVDGYRIKWLSGVELFVMNSSQRWYYSEDGVEWTKSFPAVAGSNNVSIAYSGDTAVRVIASGSTGDYSTFLQSFIETENNPVQQLNASGNIALGYWGGSGFASYNATVGLKETVPALRVLCSSPTAIGQFGNLRALSLYLNNLGSIGTSDFNDLIDEEIIDIGFSNYPFPEYLKFEKDLYPFEGNVKTGVKLIPKLSRVNDVTIYCVPTANDDPELEDATIGWIDVYANQSSTPLQIHRVTRKEAAKGYIWINFDRENINAIQFGIRWNTAHKTGKNDLMLGQAVLNYTPIYSRG